MSAKDIAFQAELENDPNGICETPTMLKSSYRFLRCLGEGAQGRTYLAEKKDTGELVAVKELKMNTADAFKGFELFMRESEVLADLDDPGVPKFYERIIPKDGKGNCYIVQEFCQNPSIQSTLDLNVRNAKPCFSVTDVLKVIKSTAEILERLEKNYTPPIVHRDIKPSNILYSKVQGEIRCWLIDFGAVANPQKRSSSSTIAGTCGYMAPEQLMGMCTPASDIYSLGMTAVHMLTEVPPWQLPVCGLEVQYEPMLREKRHDVPESLYTLLRRMTAVSVDHRIADATELLAQFRTENKEVRLIENELILVDKIDNARKKMEKQVDGILEKEYHRKMEEERAVKQQLAYMAKLTHKADMVRWMESGNDNIVMNAKVIAVVAGIIAVIIFHVCFGLKFWFFVGGILAFAGVIFLLIKKMEKNAYKKSIRNKVAQRVMGDSLEFFNGQRRLGSKRRSRRHDSAWAVTDGRVEMVKIFEIEKDKCRVEYIYMVDGMYYCGRRIRRMDALHPSPKYGELISILFAEKKPGESFFVDEGIE